MEATVVSIAKSVLDGALGVAKSAVTEEAALQLGLGVRRDLAFIKDEFDMMQTFLMAADEDQAKKKVVKAWVRQVRDLAYDAEDCLHDFSLHLRRPSWRCLLSTLRARRRITKEVKELKARVEEDVSQRNLRYRLIEDSSSNPAAATEQSSIRSAVIFGGDGPRIAAANKVDEQPAVDLYQLITSDDRALRVISVWGGGGGASDDLKKMSIIREAYDNQQTHASFRCRAWVWVKLLQPFNSNDFLWNLVREFYWNDSLQAVNEEACGAAAGVGVLKKMETVVARGRLVDEFERFVHENRYLIVIDGLSTVLEWDWIKTCFPDRKNGSRIVVSTEHAEIARLCTGQPNLASKLHHLSLHQPIYLLCKKEIGQESVPMTNHQGKHYTCFLPVEETKTMKSILPQNATNIIIESERKIKPKEPDELLEILKDQCFYRHEGWWSYEFCYYGKIRQVHVEGEKVIQEYVLGEYDADATDAYYENHTSDSADEDDNLKDISKRYHVHMYTNGTLCDLTDIPRETEVRFVCSEPTVLISSIKEISSCKYVLTMQSPMLCKNPLFQQEKRTLSIHCNELLAEDEDTAEDDSLPKEADISTITDLDESQSFATYAT